MLLERAKAEAMMLLDQGNVRGAVLSICKDVQGIRGEIDPWLIDVGIALIKQNNRAATREFIEGFN